MYSLEMREFRMPSTENLALIPFASTAFLVFMNI